MLKFSKAISYATTRQFSGLFLDYINSKPSIRDFYKYSPDLDGFAQVIKDRHSFSQETREILFNHLKEQYTGVETSELVEENIRSLKDSNTFTVTTGHQLNLFTGPMYFVYKILTVIRLSEILKEKFPEKNFVPVYWMATEDHDFDEIQYFNYRNKRYTWESDQSGAVGEFDLKGFEEFSEILPISLEEIKRCYLKSQNLAEAHLRLVDTLFNKYGLIVLDANSKSTKEVFSELMRKDCFDEITHSNVSSSNNALKELGYSTQVNPRELNYFILDKGSRDRLEKDGARCFYKNSEGLAEEIDLSDLIKAQPERLSPNVITRPIYQETILPNLAYIGGPSELAYWLQLKSSFETLRVNFPILLPRFSVTIINEKSIAKMEKSGIKNIEDIFLPERELLKKVMIENDLLDVDKHMEWEEDINSLFDSIKEEVSAIDKTLGPSAEGRRQKVLKELSKIRKKMESAVIRQQETHKNRIYSVQAEIFPGNSFQERFLNVMELIEEDPQTVSSLYDILKDPLEFNHTLIQRT